MNCGTTHHEDCPCHEAGRWRMLVEQAADEGVGLCECGRCYLDGPEKYAAVLAEIERLRDGIRRHYGQSAVNPSCEDMAHCNCWGCGVVSAANERLWALLEENHDDR